MKKLTKTFIYIIPVLIIFATTCTSNKLIKFELCEGDIIFHESKSRQSKAIQLATKSRYSHMGILFKYKKSLHVLEAVQPVKITRLQDFVKRGVNKHYVIKRLKNYERVMNPKIIKKMKVHGKKFLGKNYDKYFEWSDKKIYCSELVWKLYQRTLDIKIGKLEKLRDFDLTSPIVKKLLTKRYGKKIPLTETVISPIAMFESNLLVTIIEKGK